jgi:CDP-paratose 2-epimerase
MPDGPCPFRDRVAWLLGTPSKVRGDRKALHDLWYKGKQVRDNIHSYDLVTAFWEFFLKPKRLAVYNIGGSRHSNCSVLEAIRALEELSGRKLDLSLSEQPRSGDHIWWISDVRRFQQDYPEWRYHYDLATMLKEIVDALEERVRR